MREAFPFCGLQKESRCRRPSALLFLVKKIILFFTVKMILY